MACWTILHSQPQTSFDGDFPSLMTPKQIEPSTPSDLLLHLLNPFFFLPLSFVGFPGSQACHWAAQKAPGILCEVDPGTCWPRWNICYPIYAKLLWMIHYLYIYRTHFTCSSLNHLSFEMINRVCCPSTFTDVPGWSWSRSALISSEANRTWMFL